MKLLISMHSWNALAAGYEGTGKGMQKERREGEEGRDQFLILYQRRVWQRMGNWVLL